MEGTGLAWSGCSCGIGRLWGFIIVFSLLHILYDYFHTENVFKKKASLPRIFTPINVHFPEWLIHSGFRLAEVLLCFASSR